MKEMTTDVRNDNKLVIKKKEFLKIKLNCSAVFTKETKNIAFKSSDSYQEQLVLN